MNYYNEHDPKAAAWLRVLIDEGHIAKGEVDERDIQDVRANELAGYAQCHFFAGIGGWSLALRLAGIPDDYPVWTGSCPCQPFSCAGSGMAEDDERHLWPDFRNLIGQRRPPIVFGEQVESKLGREWLAGVRADLEAACYRFAAADLCAAGVGAPQRRQRLFWVANSILRGCAARSDAKPGQEGGRAFTDESSQLGSMAIDQSEGRAGVESELKTGQREWAWTGRSGTTSALADSEHSKRRSELPRNEQHGNDAGRNETAGRAGTCGEDGRLVHAGYDAGCSERKQQLHGCCGIGESGEVGVALGDSIQPRLEGQSGNGNGSYEPGRLDPHQTRPTTQTSPNDFWREYRLIQTSDGKTRRIPAKPSVQLLADGISDPGMDDGWLQSDGTVFPLSQSVKGRVAILKGFGNAIVPQAAAQFIRAYFETLRA